MPTSTYGELPLFDPPSDAGSGTAAPVAEELLMQILRRIDAPQPKRPLQCVTYKMPLPHYLAMKETAQQWCISYSDLLRIGASLLTPALREPGDQLRGLLEAHRKVELEKRAARDLKRRGLRRPTKHVLESPLPLG